MSNDSSIVWKPSGRRHQSPVLIGREIEAGWLHRDHAEVFEVSLNGQLLQSLKRLREAASEHRINLPIISLRLSLSYALNSLVFLDTDLGLKPVRNGGFPPAMRVLATGIDGESELSDTLKRCFDRWLKDHVLQWCARWELDALAGELPTRVDAGDFVIARNNIPYVQDNGAPNFDLIARRLGDQLAGEALFEGMGGCELIIDPEGRGNNGNRVSLMTPPVRIGERQGVFSMVAHLDVITLPYKDRLFLKLGATKRNWAHRKPSLGFSATGHLNAYAIQTNCPVIPVPVRRTEDDWVFHEDYQALLLASGGALPADLETALAKREHGPSEDAWVGLPENPTLYRSVAPRTVFEADEMALAETVSDLLAPLVSRRPIQVKGYSLPKRNAPNSLTMLKLDDFGAAGAVFDTSEEEDGGSPPTGSASGRQGNLDAYREQNQWALESIHGEATPLVILFGGYEAEQSLAQQTVDLLFGEALDFQKESLPQGTHGIRENLEKAKAKPRTRFEARVACWQPAAERIKQIAQQRPVIALICAAKEIGRKHEDPVNYYAGIHALARAGANVHHVLPMTDEDDDASQQDFVHRLQSALLDVVFAHAGKTLGVESFINRVLPEGKRPQGVYGIQAIRSRKDHRSGQVDVCLVLYSRTDTTTGTTSVRIGHRQGSKQELTDWMPLAQGLRWLASQRKLQDGDDRWLKTSFEGMTKGFLSELHEKDPYAVVMVDWQSVAGLWPGLSDRTLNTEKVARIGQIRLDVMDTMTLLRIRRGPSTLSLRTESRQHFTGIQEGAVPKTTGEDIVHRYASTTRMLVALPDAVSESSGHFFASMGYSKQSQLLRGLSCYRSVTRMTPTQDQQFVLEAKAPAHKDASISATMEMTVMQSPSGVAPEAYAKLAMGLRVGFAHYDHWTALPMPLFFRGKVEDYIIRYPESDAEAVPTTVTEAPEQSVVANERTQALIDAITPTSSQAASVQEDGADTTSPAPGGGDEEDEAGQQSDEAAICLPGRDIEMPAPVEALDAEALLELAQTMHIPRLALFRGKVSRFYRESFREAFGRNPRAQIQVQLPAFVIPKELFQLHASMSKSSIRQSFDWLGRIDCVKSNARRPSKQQYLPALARTLHVPQSMSVLISAFRYIGPVSLRPLAEIIQSEVNPTLDAEAQIRPEQIDREEIELLWRHAQSSATAHDALTAWLVFVAAQLPEGSWSGAVANHLSRIPGPMSDQALRYYVATGRAVARVLECVDHKQSIVDIHETIPEMPMTPSADENTPSDNKAFDEPAHTLPSHQTPEADDAQASAPVSTSTVEPSDAGQVASDDRTSLAAELAAQLDRIEPGSDRFETDLEAFQSEVHAAIERLRYAHDERLEARRQEESRERERQERLERQQHCERTLASIQERITPILDAAEATRFVPCAVTDDNLEAVESDLEALAPAIDAANQAMEALEAHMATPAPTQLQARREHNRHEGECIEAVTQAADKLQAQLSASTAFVTDPSAEEAATPSSDPSGVMPPAEQSPANEQGMAPEQDANEAPEAGPSEQEAPQPQPESSNDPQPASAVETPDASAVFPAEPEEADEPEEAAPRPSASITEDEEPGENEVPQASEPMSDPVEEDEGEALEEEPEETEETEEASADAAPSAEVLHEAAKTLNTFLQFRLYGLARTQVSATGALAGLSDDPAIERHHLILEALTDSLTDMDAHQSYAARLPEAFPEKVLLDEQLCHYDDTDAPAIALGILAAGIGHALFDQGPDRAWQITNAVAGRLSGYPAIYQLVEHLDNVRKRGIVLTRDQFLGSRIGSKESMRREIRRMQEKAAHWAQAPEINSTFNHSGFFSAHKALFGADHPVGRCLEAISAGDSARVTQCYEQARRKFEKPKDTINELFKSLGVRGKPEGLYRSQAIENIQHTEQFIKEYLRLAEQLDAEVSEIPENTRYFLDRLHKYLAAAIEEVEGIPANRGLEDLYRDAAGASLRLVAGLFDSEPAEPCLPIDQQQLLITLPMNADRIPNMHEGSSHIPALCTPYEVFEQTDKVLNNLDLSSGGKPTQALLTEALEAAMNDHRINERFLPCYLIQQALPESVGSSGYNKALAKDHQYACSKLIEDLQKARQRVTHAMTLNALEDAQSSYMETLIADMLTRCQQEPYIGTPEGADHIYPDFPHAKAALRHHVTQPLGQELQAAEQKLRVTLEEKEASGQYRRQDIRRILDMIVSPDAASLRTAYDAVAMLDNGGVMPSPIESETTLAGPFDEAIQEIKHQPGNKRLLQALRERLDSHSEPDNEPDWLGALDADARGEARELIDTWLAYFKERNNTPERLEDVLKALGLTTSASPLDSVSRRDKHRFTLDPTIFHLSSSDDEALFIPPALGSDATSIEAYVAFNPINESDFRKILPEVNDTPTLMLARSEFTMAQRAEQTANTHLLLVDDALVAYMAMHPDQRLKIMLRVGMLTFGANPYDDFNTRPVASEMFFGRQEELKDLRSISSLAVLYGGRRLGKSSLLHQIDQEMKERDTEHSVFLSMTTDLQDENFAVVAWHTVLTKLMHAGLVEEPRRNLTKPGQFTDHIEQSLLRNGVKRLYLLLDECDEMIGCELRCNSSKSSFIHGLSMLASNLDAQGVSLRAVIAGLHNATRLMSSPNSAFGKMEPIALRPFSSAAEMHMGVRLITKPLAALGYTFDHGNEDLPLRILSICNAYPALIQIYCKALVRHMQNKRQNDPPPISITSGDLDVVERDEALLSELQNKFKLNLDLDKRYKAIGLILADNYYTQSEQGNFDGLDVQEIRDLCEVYVQEHFQDARLGLYEALLDEMCQLNILKKHGGRYAMRNPHIAMMLGNRDRISALISDLANEPPEGQRNHGEQRVDVVRGHASITFPMPVAWIRNHLMPLAGEPTELLILTGNAVSGITAFNQAIGWRDPLSWSDMEFVPLLGSRPDQVKPQLRKLSQARTGGVVRQIMVLRNEAWQVSHIPEYAAMAKLASPQTKNSAYSSSRRLMLVAQPERALEIAEAIDAGDLEGIDNWRVVGAPPWGVDAVAHLLRDHKPTLAENRQVLEALIEATSGFGREIQNLCTNQLTEKIALEAPQTQAERFESFQAYLNFLGMPPRLADQQGETLRELLSMLDGESRQDEGIVEDALASYGIGKARFKYLQWMGLIQEGPHQTWIQAPLLHCIPD